MTDAIELAPFDEDSYYQDPLGFFARLRESRPVAPVRMPGYGQAWIVTRYAYAENSSAWRCARDVLEAPGAIAGSSRPGWLPWRVGSRFVRPFGVRNLGLGVAGRARMRILVYEYLETSLLKRGLGGEVIEMAERRKVGNLMALSLLTLLTERPMYPYEMASELRGRGKDQSIKINWGSFYTVVQNLEKYGFIEAVNVGREGRQPERTTYQITEAGLAELKDWLRELLSVPEREYTRFEAALGEAAVLPPDEVADLLRRRLEALDATIAEHQAGMKTWGAGLPRLFLIESEYHLALRQAEAEWVRGLLEEFTDGTFPGLDGWRHFHETGEFPADLMPLIGPGGQGTAQEGGPQAAAREGDGAKQT